MDEIFRPHPSRLICEKMINQVMPKITPGNERIISDKGQTIIWKYDDLQQCETYKYKVMMNLTPQKIKLYTHILDQVFDHHHSELSKRLSQQSYEQISENKLGIKSQFIKFVSATKALQYFQPYQEQFPWQKLSFLTFDLLEKLVDDGNRPFLATFDNVFLEGASVALNHSSFVGIAFLELNESIKKEQFKQIYSLLPSNLQRECKSSKANYTRLKQRSLILFLLSFLLCREMNFISSSQMQETMTLEEGLQLLRNQKKCMKKYLSNKSIVSTIRKFQVYSKLHLESLTSKILINEESLSWPEFISELINASEPSSNLLQLEQNLHMLANYHWKQLPVYSKRKLQDDGWISSFSLMQQLSDCQINFFLMRLTKTPLSMLREQPTFSRILDKPDSFDKLSYYIWNNFVKILLLKQTQFYNIRAQTCQNNVIYTNQLKLEEEGDARQLSNACKRLFLFPGFFFNSLLKSQEQISKYEEEQSHFNTKRAKPSKTI